MKKILFLTGCVVMIAAASSLYWTAQADMPEVQAVDPDSISQDGSNLQTLAEAADLIVIGRAVDTRSEWVEDGRVLVTLATVEVGETVKGGDAERITVVLPGGTDVNRKFPVAMTYAGAPSISQGEEVLLFLEGESLVPGGYAIGGFNAGKFSIVEGEDGKKLIAPGRMKEKARTGPGIVRGNAKFVELDEVKGKVKRYLANQ